MDFDKYCAKHPLFYLIALIISCPFFIAIIAVCLFIGGVWECSKGVHTEVAWMTKDAVKTGKIQWKAVRKQ